MRESWQRDKQRGDARREEAVRETDQATRPMDLSLAVTNPA